ncbi:TPA: AmmeMemoRadiSam system protein B [Candidatus Uhrbacteria bacterium]|nr:MAG: AmmeMemoRadiSam system protein B [Candidatus Uhrbacteria bacterium RIFCSPHIGHO2_02_FULL_54_11]HAL55877.1 AmmeMemoRadiSam system protein B [Bacteroidota bacterium]HBL39245.1 AmmeMemoRadiSam system protein B [Candidatus Uhrbacteria bacterium]
MILIALPMLIHASFLPHSPLLLKEVHPERYGELEKTHKAIETLRHDLYALQPDTLCIISGHGERCAEAFSIDLAPEYRTDMKPFGDLSEPTTHVPAAKLIDRLQRHLRKEDISFTLSTNETLEYGTAVVLRLLGSQFQDVQIIPLAYSDAEAKEHAQFGKALRDVLDEASERVAVIATGDLSHCLSSEAPGGFCKEGQMFDDAVVRAVQQGSLSNLLSIPKEIVLHAQESGYHPLLILYGLLDTRLSTAEVLSYEHPFGVGYLVAQFRL